MNEPTTPAEDELVTAVLDGEATHSERTQVDADPRLRARLREFEALRRQIAPVAPVPDDRRSAMIDAAAATHTVRRLSRERRHRRALTVLTVAAVAIVVVPLLAITLLRAGSETSVDSASAPTAGDAAESPGAEPDVAASQLAPSVDAPDLGLLTSTDQLRVIIGGALQANAAADAERQSSRSSQTTATTPPAPLAAGSQTAIGACASSLAATDPTLGEPLLSATASWKGSPSFVLVFRSSRAGGAPSSDVIVVTTTDCAPVERVAA